MRDFDKIKHIKIKDVKKIRNFLFLDLHKFGNIFKYLDNNIIRINFKIIKILINIFSNIKYIFINK